MFMSLLKANKKNVDVYFKVLYILFEQNLIYKYAIKTSINKNKINSLLKTIWATNKQKENKVENKQRTRIKTASNSIEK